LGAFGFAGFWPQPQRPLRQLELAAQHRLRSARLADGGHAARGELRDLHRCVEAGAIDVAVDPAVLHLEAGRLRGLYHCGAHLRRERPAVQDPVRAGGVSGLEKEGAQ